MPWFGESMSSSRTSSLSEARKSSYLVLHGNKIGSKRNRVRYQLGMAYALVEDNMEGANLIDKVVWNDMNQQLLRKVSPQRGTPNALSNATIKTKNLETMT